ncbi:4Fe-4S single cluster domain-containing protein [Spongiactinospora sp. TRM90649]|uniref:4Fe-4S single cluster domain-containing protein n=1 Tax=Spongiactinospora sp. TRM90649 TaxID=3031114 RepID=UPI0023F6AEC6|nr:4Fe-4S single cluster domain-containing protein [Spongiactinospora sp. TRM90649]MDF5757495.1 4Fe-4S single cluster domain-containing protein [Spongiactinospora sp. TRM90649]
MTELRIRRAHFPVTALGPGTRLGIWVQGCSLACRGCMSRDTWDPNGGRAVRASALAGLWRDALAAGAEGLTVSGGEPLQQPALASFLTRAAAVRDERAPGADILLYTGYEPEELDEDRWSLLAGADTVVTGRYVASRPTRLLWRGSANQRMIPLTPLGRDRYAPYLAATADHPPVQVDLDRDGDLLVIGVPPPGTLSRLEHALRAQGTRLRSPSWRTPG